MTISDKNTAVAFSSCGRICVLAGLLLSGVGSAHAVTATANLGVSITIEATCAISSVSDVAFGTAGLLNAEIPATGSFQVQCSDDTDYMISLGTGTGTGATTAQRAMSDGTEAVTYSLYHDASHTLVWGEDSGTDTLSASGTGSTQSYTVYGLVPVQTTPPAGDYSDTVIISVDY